MLNIYICWKEISYDVFLKNGEGIIYLDLMFEERYNWEVDVIMINYYRVFFFNF